MYISSPPPQKKIFVIFLSLKSLIYKIEVWQSIFWYVKSLLLVLLFNLSFCWSNWKIKYGFWCLVIVDQKKIQILRTLIWINKYPINLKYLCHTYRPCIQVYSQHHIFLLLCYMLYHLSNVQCNYIDMLGHIYPVDILYKKNQYHTLFSLHLFTSQIIKISILCFCTHWSKSYQWIWSQNSHNLVTNYN